MASRNLEQGILAVQQQQLEEGQRLLKYALKNDTLSPSERVSALAWLAETSPDLQFKIQTYREALQIDPNNQDLKNRLAWAQQTANQQQSSAPNTDFRQTGVQANPNQNWQQGNTPSQGMQPTNPNWQQQSSPGTQPLNPNWQQGNTPSQGMQPTNPNWQQQSSPGTQPLNPNWQQGNTPSQGMQPTNPNWQQQGYGNTPSQGMQPTNPNWQQGNTPSQGMQSANPNLQQGYSTYGTQAVNPQNPVQQQPGYGKATPVQIPTVQRSVGILDGPNGSGTGFFVTKDGLVATTRYIVGGELSIHVQLMSGQHLEGQIVRSFPELDLAFVQVNAQLAHLMTTTQMPNFPHNMNIVSVPHSADGLRSTIRATRNAMAPYWFPTVINDIPDAGGHPVFDDQRLLIGMLTKNASRSNEFMYGLHIHKIYQCVNAYMQEKQQLANTKTAYCDACGAISQAPAHNGFYCEHCGNSLSYAKKIYRFPQPNLSYLYGENKQAPCPNCQSQVGFYNRKCLRCGFEL